MGCPGKMDIGHRTVPNYGGFDLGTVPMSRAFASSCNTTFAELASRMPPRGLTQAAAQYGIGPDYNIEIIEAHHNRKKDSPSGTAAKLAEIAATSRGLTMDEHGVYGRKGMIGERPVEEIGVHAVRAGDIVGEHTVIFAGPGERIELTHRAHSRDTFANGAIKAAIFLSAKPPRMYTMKDVLTT